MTRHLIAVTVLVLIPIVTTGAAPVHHQLSVRLSPENGSLAVTDQLSIDDSLRDPDGGYTFTLHRNLALELASSDWRLAQADDPEQGAPIGINATTETVNEPVPLTTWHLRPASAQAAWPVTLHYHGVIAHALATQGEEYQRSFSETPGLIEHRGAFLAGTSHWVPTVGNALLTFELQVTGLEPPWDVVSQGQRIHHELAADGSRQTTWSCGDATEEVYLVAGPWHEYHDRHGEVAVYAFLRSQDDDLARRYLAATGRYLDLYNGMLPAFPFPSFALVENFWETGYGMPGFTLLGPKVIRFPWILTSSYPHELLHNWWGNSVYVELERGNWCEGLTAYLADHLFKEQSGQGAEHRRAVLKGFTDFVSRERDLPLTEFHARRSAATAAVGYGKSLMILHMVRRAVGDELFLEALSSFFTRHRFDRATFDDLADAFSETTGAEWRPFFDQWISRTGAPEIELAEATARQLTQGDYPWQISVTLRQVQPEQPFPLTIPVAVTLEEQEQAVWAEVGFCPGSRSCAVVIPCRSKPLRVDVDPAFDVMRRLDPLEVPPTLSTVLGAGSQVFVLPAAADQAELDAWRQLAVAWAAPEEPELLLDSELTSLPERPAWVLGWHNRLAAAVTDRLARFQVRLAGTTVTLPGRTVDGPEHSLVLVARAAHDPSAAIAWVAGPEAAIPGLTRKLPHYGKYSSLVFTGDEPTNTSKGMWQPLASPLVRQLHDGEPSPLVLPPRQPLAELPPALDSSALMATVTSLSAPEMAGRGLGSPGLDQATAWVEARLASLGLEPAGEHGSFRSSWTWTGGEPSREMVLTNLLARLPGTDQQLADQPVIVMAHLDHLGRGWPDVRQGNQGKIHAGADDNASGVAVLLELAGMLAEQQPRPRPVLLAVVTGEEAGRLGSIHLVKGLEAAGVRPMVCLNLDTVGRLGTGKLLVLNTASARELPHVFMGIGYTTGAPISLVAEPLDASDQASCLEAGIPAAQLFTGPHSDYHSPGDTADRIDADGLATVTEVCHEAVRYLAERQEPLTVTLTGHPAAAPPSGPPAQGRRVSLGTTPDFSFSGEGVRVSAVAPGSAAETAGIVAGDIVTAVAGQPVTGLRDLAQALRQHQPGDQVQVTVHRQGQELVLEAHLQER